MYLDIHQAIHQHSEKQKQQQEEEEEEEESAIEHNVMQTYTAADQINIHHRIGYSCTVAGVNRCRDNLTRYFGW